MACWEHGQRRRAAHLDLAWQFNTKGHPRVGIIVPRHSQTAVARNRLRRRLREIVRRDALARLPAVDLVVRARRGAYAAPFAALRVELTDALARIS
jgi:ribonuclease P protein component